MKPFLLFVLPVLMALNACDDNERELLTVGTLQSFEANCEGGANFIVELVEPIPAEVKTIGDTDYFFAGNRQYLKVDAKTYIPEIFEATQEEMIRIYSPDSPLTSGANVMIEGSIFGCTSGNHGRLTNNFYRFYVIAK